MMDDEESDIDCKNVGAWPALIAAIIVLVVLVGIAFTGRSPNTPRAMAFVTVLIGGIIWAAIIYWLCITGNHALGWTLLIFPFALYLSWYIGKWLASVTVPEECVAEQTMF